MIDPNTRIGAYYAMSCLPEHLIDNYNQWLAFPTAGTNLYAYLF